MTIRKVSAGALADGSITAAKLAANSVETAKIAALNVTAAKIGTGAVDASQLNTGAVTTAKLADLNVTTAKIATGAVTADKFADGSITTAKIADLHVTTAKIADLSVTTGKIGTGAVQTANIYTGAVTTAKIADLNVTRGKLESGAAKSVIGNNGASTGAVADVLIADLTAGLNTFAPSGVAPAKGLVPAPGGTTGTSSFLREDGTWTAPPAYVPVSDWLYSTHTSVTGTDGGAATDVVSFVVPANQLAADNDWIEYTVCGLLSNETPTVAVYVDDALVADLTAVAAQLPTGGSSFRIDGHIYRATNTGAAADYLVTIYDTVLLTSFTYPGSTMGPVASTTLNWATGPTMVVQATTNTGADLTIYNVAVKSVRQ